MSTKYTFSDSNLLHFITFSVVDWIDVFTRITYKDIFIDSIRYCQKNKGLELYGWVIMTNHVHKIISATGNSLSNIVRDLKKHTSLQLKDAINGTSESRKDWMMQRFTLAGKANSNNDNFQFWQQDNHPLLLLNPAIAHQKLDYIHYNPVTAGFVEIPEHYLYSSARDYYTSKKGLLDIIILESLDR